MKTKKLRWLLLTAVLIIATRAALFFTLVPYDPKVQDRDHYWQIARSLLEGMGFARDGRPTNLRPPMAPLFFSGVMSLLGDHSVSIALANWMIDAATGILVYFISVQLLYDKRVALVSSTLFALYVPEMYYSWQAISEPLFGLFLASFALAFLQSLQSPSTKGFAIAGILLGAAGLTRSTMLYYFPIALGMLIWLLYPERGRLLKWAAAFSLSFLLALIPWTVHKCSTFGVLIVGDSNLGRTLYHGSYGLVESRFLQYHTSDEGSASLRQVLWERTGFSYDHLPEPEFDRLAREEALKIIRQHPVRYILLSSLRLLRMWYFIEGPRAWLSYPILALHAILIALAMKGAHMQGQKILQQGVFLLTLVLFVNISAAAVRANVRYIVPVVPLLMPFAAATIVRAWGCLAQVGQVRGWLQLR